MKINLAISAFAVSTGVVSAETIRGKGVQRGLAFKDLQLVAEFATNPEKYPLGRCQGDCDNDGECRDLLQCFKREPGSTVTVPGCYAEGQYNNPGKDYCTQRNREGVGTWLMKVGDDGLREDNGNNMTDDPLGECQGDCDEDNQCKPGLACFKRKGETLIPGCLNEGGDPGQDYCIEYALVYP
eukprot:227305_1